MVVLHFSQYQTRYCLSGQDYSCKLALSSFESSQGAEGYRREFVTKCIKCCMLAVKNSSMHSMPSCPTMMHQRALWWFRHAPCIAASHLGFRAKMCLHTYSCKLNNVAGVCRLHPLSKYIGTCGNGREMCMPCCGICKGTITPLHADRHCIVALDLCSPTPSGDILKLLHSSH